MPDPLRQRVHDLEERLAQLEELFRGHLHELHGPYHDVEPTYFTGPPIGTERQ